MISLKPFGHRASTAAQIADRLKRRVAGVEGISLNLQPRQDLRIGGRITASQYQYTLKDADVPELDKWATVMLQKLKSLPQLRDVTSDAQASATTATLKIDRDTASRLGITTQAIDDTLYDAFGQRQVATLFTQLNQYHVVEEVDPRFQLSTEALKHLYLRSSISNQLVPLSLVATVVDGVSSPIITHQALFPSVTLSFNLAPGYALGDAVDAVRIAEGRVGKPSSVVASFQGTAQAFQSSLKSQPWLIVAALVAVYIVLGVLYESAIHPLTVISTLPSAGVGALVALILFGYDLSVMGLIGIFLLIGIVKKNAIMMIDFALVAQREQGLSPREAIYQGALLRFRPIMMTTMAALLGALPLALGTGPGSELRVPLGISIAGGLLVSQALTLFTTPVVYIWFERMRQASRGAERSQSEGVDLSARHTS
jgi:multidrug efflux pump